MSADQATYQSLVGDLGALGVRRGQDLLVHSSLRRIGKVAGGAVTVLRALRTTIGRKATLVVPTQTPANSHSSRAFLASIGGPGPDSLARFRADTPGYDPATSPSTGMGVLAEHLRTRPGAMRSAHPQTSFAALGPRAADCVAGHELNCHLGEQSPLGWLYRADAAVLLLGVGYAACTAFHLAEYLLPGAHRFREYRCFTLGEGKRRERSFTALDLDDSDFEAVGASMDREPFARRGRVGTADCRLFPVRAAVDFAAAWPPFQDRRTAS